MSLKAYFATLFIAIGLFSCSENEIMEEDPNPQIVYDATLSLALKHDASPLSTKAGEEPEPFIPDPPLNTQPNYVTTISMAVFQNNVLVAYADKETNDEGKKKQEIVLKDIKVPAGHVKLVVLANTTVPAELQTLGTSITAYQDMTCTLDHEINGTLSMSSGFLEYDLRAGHNYIGYTSGNVPTGGFGLDESSIKLHHNVANINFYNLELKPKSEYIGKGDVYFKLKEVFVTNVKSVSKSIRMPETEINANNEWWNGGAIGESLEDAKNFLNYNYVTPPENMEAYNKRYFFVNSIWDKYYKYVVPGSKEEVLTNNPKLVTEGSTYVNKLGYGNGLPYGVDYYVYENTDENRPTALVLKGDYIYYPNSADVKETIKDTYYTIIINETGISTNFYDNSTTTVPKFVHHNMRYVIYATIVGPGSEKPLESNISASIKVEDWGVRTQEEEVE